LVVSIEDLDLSAHDAALGVDLLGGKPGAHLNLPAVICMRARRNALGADLDGALRVRRPDERRRKHSAAGGHRRQEPPSIHLVFPSHDFSSLLIATAADAGRRRQSAHRGGLAVEICPAKRFANRLAHFSMILAKHVASSLKGVNGATGKPSSAIRRRAYFAVASCEHASQCGAVASLSKPGGNFTGGAHGESPVRRFGAKPDLWPAGRSCRGWIDFVILLSAFDRTAPCKSTFTAMSAPFTYNVNTAVIIK